MDLQKIIEECRQNNAYCQELLFKKYAPRILTVCRRYETAHFGAMDILQETFLAVFKNIKQYDNKKASIETWIKRIAINKALKVLRDKKIETVHLEPFTDFKEEIFEEVERISEEQILAIILELPDGYRTVFNLYVLDEYSHKEIAQMLQISEQTSKSQLSKAKKMIRAKLAVFKKNNEPIIIYNGR